MDCGFLGIQLPPGEKKLIKAEFDEDVMETLHITQVALGPKPKPGPHVVMVEKGGQKFAIGTLDSARCTQFSCDFALAMDEVTLSHSGGSEVHLTGYRVEQMIAESDGEDGYGFGSDESEEESEPEEESEDEEAPDAVPLKGTVLKPVKPRARSLIDDEAEESSGEEEEDEDMEDDEDEEDSEEEAGKMGGRVVRIVGDDEESSEEEEESSGEEEEEAEEAEEEEEEEEEESEEEEPAPAAAKKQAPQQPRQQAAQPAAKQQQQQGGKRPVEEQAAAKTPQPSKKAKIEQLKAPATAPAKVAAAAAAQATPSNEKEYVGALKEALKSGPLKLAQLGTKVKRPPGVHKVKHVIDTNQNVFKYNKDTDQVSLK